MLSVQLLATTEDGLELVGHLAIQNDATGTPERGNYRWTLQSKDEIWSGEERDYERSRGAWALVKTILNTVDVEL